MTRTVDELRNDVRLAVGRFERVESTGFTKETLAAICRAVDYDVGAGRLPPKSEMRIAIRRRVGRAGGDDQDVDGGAFRKADLEAIAASLGEE